MNNNQSLETKTQHEKFAGLVTEILRTEEACQLITRDFQEQKSPGGIKIKFGNDVDARLSYLNQKLLDVDQPLIKRYLFTEIGKLFGLLGQIDRQINYFDNALETHAADSKDFFDFCYNQAREKILADGNNSNIDEESLRYSIYDDKMTRIASLITTKSLKDYKCNQLMLRGEYHACKKLIRSGKYIKFNNQTVACWEEKLAKMQEYERKRARPTTRPRLVEHHEYWASTDTEKQTHRTAARWERREDKIGGGGTMRADKIASVSGYTRF